MAGSSREDAFTQTREAVVLERRSLIYQRCRITITGGPAAASSGGPLIETEKDILRIGSAVDNDLVVQDPAVSRYHLEVRKKSGEYVIVDCNSTNGTFVGSLRVKEATVRQRSELHVGDSSLLFEPIDTEVSVEPSGAERCEDLVGSSIAMREVYTLIERVAATDLTILVTGETGTGKELAARALHKRSRRGQEAFVTLDCSALPPTLVESALFGHEKGAFAGADQAYAGVFERADGGTLFLDELGELPIDLQPKLLRALSRGEIQRLRGDKTLRVNVRVIGATHRDLHRMVQENLFRGDLYYRLAMIRIHLPALRERVDDIPVIVEEFFRRYDGELRDAGVRATRLGRSALAALSGFMFPGNVRQLMNVLRRAAVFAEGDEILATDLPEEITGDRAPVATPPTQSTQSDARKTLVLPDASIPFKDAKARVLDKFERQYLVDLLLRHKQNISKASREAGIDRRHLYRLLDKYEIDVKDRGTED